jgi:hypothetical protein
MMGVAMVIRPDTPKPEIHEFEGKLPTATFRREALGGEGEVVPHFTAVTWDGAIYNCIAFHRPSEGRRRNATATMLIKRLSQAHGTRPVPCSSSMAMMSS